MRILRLIIIYAVIIFPSYAEMLAQNVTKISGQVIDTENRPLPYVNVYILNSVDGAMSDENGTFEFTTNTFGKIELVASIIGFTKKIYQLNLESVDIRLEIILEENTIELKEAVVMGSSFSSEKQKGLVITNIDVYTTPGGGADLFQSLKTMPGVTNVSESAELYVRGGNPLETITIIDQASVYHPYTYESSYGGLFSNFNTAVLSSMYFSSGGFSVKYGNVLSGVLDIETKSEPLITQFGVGLSLAAAAFSAEVPFVDNKFGLRIYTQKSYTEALMWVNGEIDDFTSTPESQDITSILSYNYSKTGKLKIVGSLSSDNQGVRIKRAEYSGSFEGNTNNSFINLQHADIINKTNIIKNSISFNTFSSIWKLGLLDLDKADKVFKVRSDLESIISNTLKLSTGIEYENRRNLFRGIIPAEDFDIRPEGKGTILNEEISGDRIGAYSELTINNFFGLQKLHFVGGIRSDYIPETNRQTFDPRIGLFYKLNPNSTLKLSWGFFHQSPDLRLSVPVDGNPNLGSMRAEHYLISFDQNLQRGNSFRLELYYKDYSNLPLKDESLNYSNNGYGFAYGADIVLKGELPFGLDGWISYGYLNTKRKWMDFKELTRSGYDITHGLSLILKYNLSAMWQIGANLKYSSGRPYTPVIASDFDTGQGIYVPIYGTVNSESYPDYKRLDMRLTHFNRMFDKYFTVFYLEALNILDINNLFDYTYSSDYSIKNPVQSYFGRRTLVLGFSMNI